MPIELQPESHTFTYQTRVQVNDFQGQFLKNTAQYFSKIEHALFADFQRGKNIQKLKSVYLQKYQITARQFNAIRISLEGKIRSIQELRNENLSVIKCKIQKIKKSIRRIKNNSHRIKNANRILHQKNRALIIQEHRQKQLKSQLKQKKVGLCFGSKKLFRRQFNLEANGYSSHEDWGKDWKQARESQFFLIGSKDETMGNQSCVGTINADSTLDLRIRVPDYLSKIYGKYVVLNNVPLHYGKEDILSALSENSIRRQLSSSSARKENGDTFKQYGTAVNYRFLLDEKGWSIFITVDKPTIGIKTDRRLGAIGVDINSNHLAVTEIDSKGNYIHSFDIALNLYGKSQGQALALIGDAVAKLANYALEKQKPMVVEKLDFQNKKNNLSQENKKYSRQLSSFAYSKILQHIRSKAFRLGVGLHEVNPAYSSVIGRVKFSRIYHELSVHQAAALVIARRLFSFSERLPRCWDRIPGNQGGQVTLPVLVKIPGRHIWHTWAIVTKNLQKAHVAQYQMLKQRAGPCFDKEIPF